MAGKRPLLRIGGDITEARKALATLKADAKDFERIRAQARFTVETAAAQAKLDQLNARLSRLAAQEYSPKVALQEGQVTAQIARVEEKLRRLNGQTVRVNVKVDSDSVERSVKGLARAIPTGAGGGFFSGILKGIAGTVAGIGSLAGAVGSGVSSLASLVPVVGQSAAGFLGLAAAMVTAIPLLGLFAAGITLVVGVLGALAASFAGAIAGAAVLATAFGGALLGPVAIAIAAFVKLISIFKAFGQQQKSAAADGQAVQSAALQQASAQRSLADAYENLARQTQAAKDAQVDATEAVSDDIRTRARARIDIDQAKLDTKKAEQALREFKAPSGANLNGSAFKKFTNVDVDEGALKGALSKASAAVGASTKDSLELQQLVINVRKAKQNEKETNDALSDSNRKLARDRRTESAFLTKGLAAYPGYVSALRQVRTAQDGVRRATLAANKAQDAQGKGLEDLNPKELGLAATLRGVAKSFKELFTPAIDKALDGLVRGLRVLAGVAKDPAVKKALSGIGDALRGAFLRIALFLSNKESRNALVNFLNSGRRLVRPLTDLFIAIGRTVRDLAQDALPYLEKKFRSFAKTLNSLTGGNGKRTIKFGFAQFDIPDTRTGAQRLQGTVNGLIKSFENAKQIVKGLSSIVLAFFRAGKKEGDRLTGSLGDALVKYGRFLNSPKGQEGIKGFFRDVRNIVKDLAHVLEKMVGTVRSIGKAAKDTKKNLGDILDFGGGLFDSLIGKPHQKGTGRASGGPVFGPASGHDNILTPLSGGEYIIRRSVVDALGLPFFNALNAGGNARAALASGGGGDVHHHYHPTFHTAAGTDMKLLNRMLSREAARRP